MRKSPQTSFIFRTHGGLRKGAGRKKTKLNEPVHAARPKITKHIPFHCGLKLHPQAPGPRDPEMFTAVTNAFARAKAKGLRVTEFSIEGNHIHFIAEADSELEVSKGLMSLTASITWALRKIFFYFGPVFAKRYFMHAIQKPREMLYVLIYVLFNHAKHLKVARYADQYSSAHAFEHIELLLRKPRKETAWTAQVRRATSDAASWLQREGWLSSLRQYGMPK